MLKRTLRLVGLLNAARLARDTTVHVWRGLKCRISGASNGFSVPSRRLTHLVSGHENVFISLSNGKVAAESIREALENSGATALTDLGRILDFGCGSGRVIRHFKYLGRQMAGCDYNSELLEYCEQTFPFAEFRRNDLKPPTSWDDNEFGLIYLLSIFTHLDEPLQLAWLTEFHRILKPGGFLLFSTHGTKFLDNCNHITTSQRQAFENGKLVVVRADIEGENACGAYHPVEYVRERLSRGWIVVNFLSEGAKGNGGQDFWLFQKPNTPTDGA